MRKHIAVQAILLSALILGACSSGTPNVPNDASASLQSTQPPANAAPTAPESTSAPAATAATAPTAAAEPTAATAAVPTAAAATAASATDAVPAAFVEPPVLADQVKSGALPPVKDRLPVSPAVVPPFKQIGKYGGTLRFGFTGNNPGWGGIWFVSGWENLAIWKPDFSSVQPNIAEKWDVSSDSREYTFHLRKGMKWSDGQPFTADDIMFYIDDVLFNKDISPSGPNGDWLPDDQRDGFKATEIDQFTVKFSFPKPYGTLLYQLATWSGRHLAFFPKHYLQQFHKKYNPNVDALVAKTEGIKDWVGLFNKKASGPTEDIQGLWNDPALPTLYPWIVKQPLGTGTKMTLVRNPYYWKVDPQGNQLPYIDQIQGIAYQDAESRTFAMLNGELDALKDAGDDNRVVYFDAKDQGKPLQIKSNVSDGANTDSIHFNRTIADPVKAEIFANKDFRIGMSYAINRPEIIEVVGQGQGEPAQVAPLKSSPLYNERLATQYIAYDPAKANAALDKVLPKKDAEGFRLDKTGKRLSIVLSVANDLSFGTTLTQLGELLTKYWAAVGVEVKLNAMPDAQFGENKKQNKIEATIYTGEGGAGLTAILDPRYYVPMEYNSMFGNGWTNWRLKEPNTVAVEPPQEIKDFRASFENVLASATESEQITKMKGLLDKAADEFWVIGISRPGDGYTPFSARVGNIPDTWTDGWLEGVEKITLPEQWFINQ